MKAAVLQVASTEMEEVSSNSEAFGGGSVFCFGVRFWWFLLVKDAGFFFFLGGAEGLV